MEAKQIIVLMEQSKRDKGAVTKNTIKYDEVNGGSKMRTSYVNQQELLNAFGHFPQRIILHVLDGDSEKEAA
jgi:hypothetical protein